MGNDGDELRNEIPFRTRSVVLDRFLVRAVAELSYRTDRTTRGHLAAVVARASLLRLQNRIGQKTRRVAARTRSRSFPRAAIQVIGSPHQNYSRRGR